MQVMVEKAIEGSSFFATVTYKDEDGNAITPNNAYWSLRTMDGTVVNSRTSVEITTPTTSDVIVLQGDDLERGDDDGKRLVVVWGEYDSANGTDLPFVVQAAFDIEAVAGN